MNGIVKRARRAAFNVYSKYLAWSAQREASRFINSLVPKDRSK